MSKRSLTLLSVVAALMLQLLGSSTADAQRMRSGSIWDNMRPGMTLGLVESAARAERMAWNSLSRSRSLGVAGTAGRGYSGSYTPRGQSYAGTVGDPSVGFASFSTAVGRGAATTHARGSYSQARSGRTPGGSYYARSAAAW
jgi:hypothetical protein